MASLNTVFVLLGASPHNPPPPPTLSNQKHASPGIPLLIFESGTKCLTRQHFIPDGNPIHHGRHACLVAYLANFTWSFWSYLSYPLFSAHEIASLSLWYLRYYWL